MAKSILTIGPSGTGKSHAIQFLNPKETFIINCDLKDLPFRGGSKNYKLVKKENGAISGKDTNYVKCNIFNSTETEKGLVWWIKTVAEKSPHIKTIIVDTITNAMLKSVMDSINVKGFDKYTSFAQELYVLIVDIVPALRDDLYIIFTAHNEEDTDSEGERVSRFKVPAGRFTKEKIVPESHFTIVLYSGTMLKDDKVEGYFVTQNTGKTTAKSPQGMFPALMIENNYQYVIDCANAYYNGEKAPESKVIKSDGDSKF